MRTIKRRAKSRTSWSLVPRVVWEIIAGYSTTWTLARLRSVCSQLRKLLAAWDEFVVDDGALVAMSVSMCV